MRMRLLSNALSAGNRSAHCSILAESGMKRHLRAMTIAAGSVAKKIPHSSASEWHQ